MSKEIGKTEAQRKWYRELLAAPDPGPTRQSLALYRVDHLWLFTSILIAYSHNDPIPDWVAAELEDAIERYKSFEAQTLDDAFGIHRKRNESLRAKMKLSPDGRTRRQFSVYLDVVVTRQAMKRDRAMQRSAYRQKKPQNAFKTVGEKHGLSQQTVRDWFYEQQRAFKRTNKSQKV